MTLSPCLDRFLPRSELSWKPTKIILLRATRTRSHTLNHQLSQGRETACVRACVCACVCVCVCVCVILFWCLLLFRIVYLPNLDISPISAAPTCILKTNHNMLRGRTGLVVRASDSGSGDSGSILGRVGVLFP